MRAVALPPDIAARVGVLQMHVSRILRDPLLRLQGVLP